MGWWGYLGWGFAAYALAVSVYIVLQNRRPQATLAWMLALFVLPGVGLLAYLLFGRDRKVFAKQSQLLKQDLEANARPYLDRILASQEAEIARLEGASIAHKKLMMLVRRNSQSALVRCKVEIQQNAEIFYPSLIKDIESAQHSVHLQYFIWGNDELTDRLKQALSARAKAGVEVRLLFDPVGSQAHMSLAYIKEMEAAGIRVMPTSPLWRLHTISYRNHRKITVIDGRIGYTGGMNIGKEHLDGGKGFDYWRDTQIRLGGEGVAVLQAVFAVDWYNSAREDLFASAYFPEGNSTQESSAPVQVLTSGPDSKWESIRQLYFAMIASARDHVYIQSPYFIPDASLAEALKAAALAGVDVRLMLAGKASGNPLPEWAGNTYIIEVIKAGVKVFMYEKGYMHAKTISIDSEICSIGSANIDIRSFSINYELNAVIYSKRLTRQLEQDFEHDLADCRPFDPEEYAARKLPLRFRDSVTRLVSPLL